MKTQIEVYDQNKGIEIWTLDTLREANCNRRRKILTGEGLAKVAQRKISVHDTDKTRYQICCHYPSFELRKMSAKQAVEIFNHDGSQIAKIINK